MRVLGAGWFRRRWRLLRHFAIVPRRSVVLLVLALVAGALVTPAMSLATGWLVTRTTAVSHGSSTRVVVIPLLVIGAMLVYQMTSGWVINPTRARARQLVDGAVNQRIRRAVGSLPGVGHLEDQDYRRLAALPTTGFNSIGSALDAQLQVIGRYAGAVLSAAIVARVSPIVAAITLAIVIGKRLFLRTLYAPALANSVEKVMPQVLKGGYWRHVAPRRPG